MNYKNAPAWDTLIKNAKIYDGTGKQPITADVAIKGKYIAAIGELTGTAGITINANNRVLTPGFIDVHAHDDFACMQSIFGIDTYLSLLKRV